MFINSNTGNILYRMNMCLAFLVCGVFMIATGYLCPQRIDMKDMSSQGMLRDGIGMAASGVVKGATMAVENKEKLIEIGGNVKKKIDQEEALL